MKKLSINPKLFEMLVCPLTKAPLKFDGKTNELISLRAKLAYPIRDGVPVMLVDEARPLDDTDLKRKTKTQPL